MKKPTPNPPETTVPADANTTSPYVCEDTRKLHEAADRALDFYLKPTAAIMATPYVQNQMFQVNPKADTECLGSASIMLGDFAALLQGAHRKTLLGIAQVVMLGELAVNRALDNVDPAG